MSNLACSCRLWCWVNFSMNLPSLSFMVVSISRNKFSVFVSRWEAKFSRAPINMQRGDEDQCCRGKLVLPQGFKKWIQISGHVSVSKLFYLGLWRFRPGHKTIRSRKLLKFWRVLVHSSTWYRKSPTCQREFLGIDIRSSDRHFFTRSLQLVKYCSKLNALLKKWHNQGSEKIGRLH